MTINEKTIESYFDKLWPIFRSITGNGVRETHKILSEIIPLKTIEIKSGTKVFDWVIPKEWIVKEAYLIDPDKNKILDIKDNNLHLLNYSIPFKGKIDKSELDKHLYSLPNIPDAIPYVTSYYAPRWGFCLQDNIRKRLKEGKYEVVIDTEFIDGSLTISEVFLPGKGKKEILLSTYTCHPSLANNELSGPLVTAFLYNKLLQFEDKHLSYRFVFLPETIGSITYLKLKGNYLKKHIIGGYVITCIGDRGPFTYKRSKEVQSLSNKIMEYILPKFTGVESSYYDLNYEEFKKLRIDNNLSRIINYFPDYGSDERQYNSQGFNLPIGSIMRTMYGKYKEYHTSLDNKEFISFKSIVESIDLIYEACRVFESNKKYISLVKNCEPQLGKRNLYPTVGGSKDTNLFKSAVMWLMSMSDKTNDLLTISQLSKIDLNYLNEVAKECVKKKILKNMNFNNIYEKI